MCIGTKLKFAILLILLLFMLLLLKKKLRILSLIRDHRKK